MDKNEDFILNEVYVLKSEDEDSIQNAKSIPVPSHEDWDNSCLLDYKKNLRDHLFKRQNCRCAYCRMKIHDNEARSDLEHIIPKSFRPQWMYDPFNICLSCKMCNIKKGYTIWDEKKQTYKKAVIRDCSATELPYKSEEYLIIHPYLDKYSDHITLVNECLYKGISNKGKYTIKLCGLDRYELAANRIDQLTAGNKTKIMSILFIIQNCEDSKKLLDDVDAFIKRTLLIDQIKEEINEYVENVNKD